MLKNNKNYSYLNKFLKKIILNKNYTDKLKSKIYLLTILKNQSFKNLSDNLFIKNYTNIIFNNLITYIIHISFSQSNSLLHVISFPNNLKFFCSAGNLMFKGKNKKTRHLVLKSMLKILIQKLKFLQNKPIAIHLTNVRFMKLWVIQSFKKKLFLKIVKIFNSYTHNGCRRKKIRRKKY